MDRGDSGSLSQLAHEIIDSKDPPFSAPQLLTILVESKRSLRSEVFQKLFVKISHTCAKKFGLKIKRRLLIRAPTYNKRMVSDLTMYAKKLIVGMDLPAPLSA